MCSGRETQQRCGEGGPGPPACRQVQEQIPSRRPPPRARVSHCRVGAFSRMSPPISCSPRERVKQQHALGGLPREELPAPPVHLAPGAGGPAAASGYSLPCVHDAIPGDADCTGESLPRAKPGAFVTPLLAHCLFAPCQRSWAHLGGCPAPSVSHLSSLHPLIYTERQRGAGAMGGGKASHPDPCTQPGPPGPRELQGRQGIQSSEEGGPRSRGSVLSACFGVKP